MYVTQADTVGTKAVLTVLGLRALKCASIQAWIDKRAKKWPDHPGWRDLSALQLQQALARQDDGWCVLSLLRRCPSLLCTRHCLHTVHACWQVASR